MSKARVTREDNWLTIFSQKPSRVAGKRRTLWCGTASRPQRPGVLSWPTMSTISCQWISSRYPPSSPPGTTVTFRVLFVCIALAHHRRRVIHFDVTEQPTAAWAAQHIVEAFAWNSAPSYLLRDRDGIYGDYFQRRVDGAASRVRASRGLNSLADPTWHVLPPQARTKPSALKHGNSWCWPRRQEP
jgi:hypothetical protein